MADISDEIIMQRVKDGNLAEMSVLFERYHLKLYNFFLKLNKQKDISQDLTQNLFYRMIKYKHTFKDGYSVVINSSFKDNYFKGNNCCCTKTDIYWQVYIPENTDFTIESINANITIKGKTEKMKVKSISGYIDLALPANQQADIEFSTITGTIYSNHELALTKKHSGGFSVIKEKLNNGGFPIRLETISGDIFFRKAN